MTDNGKVLGRDITPGITIFWSTLGSFSAQRMLVLSVTYKKESKILGNAIVVDETVRALLANSAGELYEVSFIPNVMHELAAPFAMPPLDDTRRLTSTQENKDV